MFCSSNSNFQTVINSVQLVQKIQGKPCVNSNFDALCFKIETKVNKESSLNLLENMLLLFTKVHTFSFARYVKEGFKARIKNPKSRSSRKETKKVS